MGIGTAGALSRPPEDGSGASAAERPATAEGPGAAPRPRGPLSAAVLETLRQPPDGGRLHWPSSVGSDPFGADLQLALQLCYELHYRGLPGVDDAWEWSPELLRFRAELERAFHTALRGRAGAGNDVPAELEALLVEPRPGTGLAGHLEQRGTWQQMREFLAHRSIYHLKEAEPAAWAIPRLSGRPKASLVAVEFDEFGGGSAERMHSALFADLLAGAGLETGYLHYLDAVPAPTLAVVNMMSLFGLHRGLRGALVGHFATVEITSTPGSRRMVRALRRMGAPEPCVRFYAEHVEADAVHEQVVRHQVVAGLLEREPQLAADVVFGVRATGLLEDDLAHCLTGAWERGESSLLVPLPEPD